MYGVKLATQQVMPDQQPLARSHDPVSSFQVAERVKRSGKYQFWNGLRLLGSGIIQGK